MQKHRDHLLLQREDEMEKYQNQTGCIKWICSLIFRDNQLVWYPYKRRALHTVDRIKCHSLSITLRSILSMDFYVWMGMGWCSFQYFICRKKGRSTVRNWLPRMEVSAFPFYWSDVLAEYWDFSLFNLIYFGCVLALCWRKPILYHNWWEWIFNECAIHFGKIVINAYKRCCCETHKILCYHIHW